MWNRSQCCPPVLGVGTNAFAIYQVWFYHITTSNYVIDPIQNNTYFTSKKSEKYVLTEIYFYFLSNNLLVSYQYFLIVFIPSVRQGLMRPYKQVCIFIVYKQQVTTS